MLLPRWLRKLARPVVRSRADRTPNRCRPAVLALEDRIQPSSAAPPRPPILVSPGQDLQAVLNTVAPGTTIFLAPGTYSQSLIIGTPSLRLVGLTDAAGNRAVLKNPGGVPNGIIVLSSAEHFTLSNAVVSGFGSNGVFLLGVHDFHLAQVSAVNDGQYGLFPVLSSSGTLDGCSATGHSAAGIFIDQSHDVTVRGSSATGNVIGFEIENSRHVQAIGNVAAGNTAGFVDVLPGPAGATSQSDSLLGNLVFGNNLANFGAAGAFESSVPSGTGILIVGGKGTAVTGNTVLNNNFTGVAVVSVNLLTVFGGIPAFALGSAVPDPTGTHVRGNVVVQNGSKPPPQFPGADLLWDGSGKDNCWAGNAFATSLPPVLPMCK